MLLSDNKKGQCFNCDLQSGKRWLAFGRFFLLLLFPVAGQNDFAKFRVNVAAFSRFFNKVFLSVQDERFPVLFQLNRKSPVPIVNYAIFMFVF